jgi:hypothetical protein
MSRRLDSVVSFLSKSSRSECGGRDPSLNKIRQLLDISIGASPTSIIINAISTQIQKADDLSQTATKGGVTSQPHCHSLGSRRINTVYGFPDQPQGIWSCEALHYQSFLMASGCLPGARTYVVRYGIYCLVTHGSPNKAPPSYSALTKIASRV